MMKLVTVKVLLAVSMLGAVLAGCDNGTPQATPTVAGGQAETTVTTASTPAGTTVVSSDSSTPVPTQIVDLANPTKITIALGYDPNIQFAPFYVALNKGYYKAAGLDVTFKHGIVPDLIKLLGAGSEGVNFA